MSAPELETEALQHDASGENVEPMPAGFGLQLEEEVGLAGGA